MGSELGVDRDPGGYLKRRNIPAVLDDLPDAILAVDRRLKILYLNRRAEELFGLRSNEIENQPLAQLFPSAGFLLPDGSQKSSLFEMEARRRDGVALRVEASVSKTCVDGQETFLLILRDCSKKTGADRSQEENGEKFRHVFESANVGKSITSTDGKISVNKAFADMLGYDRDELAHKTWQMLTPPEDIPAIEEILSKLISGVEDSARFEKRYLHKDGSHVWADVNVSTLRDQNGRLRFFITTVVDISENVKTRQKLFESEERFRSIVERSPDGVFIQVDRNFAFLNPAACQLFGISSPDELLGKPIIDSIHPDFRDRVKDRIRRLNEDRASVNQLMEIKLLRADSSEKWVETSGEPIRFNQKDGALVVVRDITQRKEAEKARSESESRFRLLAESAPVGIVITDKNLKIIYVSPRVTEYFGYTHDDLPSALDWYRLAYPDEDFRAAVRRQWQEAIRGAAERGGEIEPKTFPVTCKDGGVRQVEFRMKDTTELNFVILTDVTDRVAAEQETRRQKEILQLFIEHAPAGIAMFDRDMRYIAVSRRYLQDFEIHDQEVLGRSHYHVFPDLPERWKDIHRRCLKGAIESCDEDPYPRANNRLDWIRWEIRPWYESAGEIGGILLFSEVITDRKRSEEALHRYNDRLKNLHQIDQDILQAALSPEEVARTAVRNLCSLIGCPRSRVGLLEGTGKEPFINLIDPSHADAARVRLPLSEGARLRYDQLAQGGMEITEEGSLPSDDPLAAVPGLKGTRASIQIPLQTERGLIGVLFLGWTENRKFAPEEIEIAAEVSRQISIAIHQSIMREALADHAAELEARVAERTAELEASNKDLESFGYSVSHDLRAPLRSIEGFSQILEEEYQDRLDEEGLRLLGIIRSSTRKMDQLITDLLSLSRAGRTQMSIRPVNMTEMVQAVYDEIANPECRKRCAFRLGELPNAQGDPTLLHQVWVNLLSNAVKYTQPKADCTIEVSGIRENGECIYTIRDNGVGFDEAYKDHLFGLFQRLHRESEFEGTGVGLAIVQRIIQRHGGRVWAEGRVGAGASFHFSLPDQEQAGSA